jgi:hypothetical protein
MSVRFGTCRSSPVPHRLDPKHCEDFKEMAEPSGGQVDDIEEVEKALGDLAYLKKDARSADAYVRFARLRSCLDAGSDGLRKALHDAEQQALANAARAADMEMQRDTARRQAADYERGAKAWVEEYEKARGERDAMALALARKEIAK